MGDVIDLRGRRMYSFRQIDEIIGLPAGTAGRWIDGYHRSGKSYDPVIRPERTGDLVATWGEFVECRLLSEYRGAGVPLQRMRPAVEMLREMTGSPYPLASAQLWVAPDGRELVARVQDDVSLEKALTLVVVRTGQQVFDWSPRAMNFQRSITWSSHLADAEPVMLTPDLSNPGVVVDPLRGFGDPVIRGRNLATSVVSSLVRAGESIEQIADDYELSVGQIEAALRHELAATSA